MTNDIQPTADVLDPREFRRIIGHFASGVTIIMAAEEGTNYGTTASAVCSLTDNPPMVLVCLNVNSETGKVVERTGRLSVNVLGDRHAGLARRFATKGANRFEGVALTTTSSGIPLLDDSLACLDCRVVSTSQVGTHAVLHCAVESALSNDGEPLTYFRGGFGRFVPDAP
ncbi:hypothetical protein CH267_06565 [Rhodococcus sp. 06-621-2]|nr:flavin reductase family protein [Rhodococcus sp. 06-621-2]OZC59756.1 hypothetical protein CH267_06565 [Rhodococcus sp. 06-621-2]